MGMNTNRTGMRTVLAAAAAGALIMGSAAGAMAGPGAKGPRPRRNVKCDIHRHSPINFWDISGTPTDSVRTLKLRATVKDTKDVLVSPADVDADPTVAPAATVLVDVAAGYNKKVGGMLANPAIVSLVDVPLLMVKEKKLSKNFAAEYTFGTDQKSAIKAYLATKAAAAAAAGTKVREDVPVHFRRRPQPGGRQQHDVKADQEAPRHRREGEQDGP